MKILLVGEYSGLHLNLKDGLIKLGCKVDLISYGDSWKKIGPEENLSSRAIYPLSVLFNELNIKMLKFSRNCEDYDIVQFINPIVTHSRLQIALGSLIINKIIIKRLINKSKKSYLLAAGDDHYYFKAIESGLFKYHPLTYSEKYDMPFYKKWYSQYWKNEKLREWNIELVKIVNGVIPCLYEYDIGYEYEKVKNKRKYIPFPFPFVNNAKKNQKDDIKKLKVLHVESRYGFKGTNIVVEAFKKIQQMDVEISVEILRKMPFKEFQKKINDADVVVDQLNSYSYAYTAINALAMGKIVISGFEPEMLKKYGIDGCNAILNCQPNADQLVLKLLYLNDNKNNLLRWGEEGINFINKYHDSVKVAKQYLNEWAN